jgi:hypothetical protein
VTPAWVASAAGAASVDALWESQQRVPFFIDGLRRREIVREFTARYPDAVPAVLSAADRVLDHTFDLLGSGPMPLGPALPWHTDFKTGREWPLDYASDIDYAELDRPTDVKVPWELSRAQHFTVLGQAYWLTGDERYAQEFVAEVDDWNARNPWAYGVNWICAMDVALRAVSWIWGFHFMGRSAACASPAFRGSFMRALFLHGEYIATHLERGDVNGNHYLCDGVGLVFIGSFFRATRQGRRWLAAGKQIIDQEIFNQTTEDGVDFEKSTAYHRLVLEAFLTSSILLELHGEPPSPQWKARLERMFEFVEAYIKPDGTMPLIGDADDGRVQKLGIQGLNDHRYLLSIGAALFGRPGFKRGAQTFWDEAFWLLGGSGAREFDRLPLPDADPASAAFPSAGFYVLRSARAHVFVDCGEVGMQGRGGHGHNDILSFELWLDGVNLITDCGAYLYTASPEWRDRFRSTAFHNVVQVDGEELNRFPVPPNLWQLRDDARPHDVRWQTSDEVDCFAGSHNGYQRLAPPVRVTRGIELRKPEPQVIVRDQIHGEGVRELVWRFHCDPAITATVSGTDVLLAVAHAREMWMQLVPGSPTISAAIERGWVSPAYGVRVPADVIVLRASTALPVAATFRFGAGRYTAGQLSSLEPQCVNS